MAICQLYSIQLLKELKSNPKQLSCKKHVWRSKKAIEKKRCEIQGGNQEMAVMVCL